MSMNVSEKSPKREHGSYLRVKEHIFNRFRAGDKLPPEPDLAQELGLTRYATLRGLTELQAEGFIKREQGRGTFVVDIASKTLARKTNLVGIIAPNFKKSLEAGLIERLRHRLGQADLDLVLWGSEGISEAETRYLRRVEEIGLAGLVMWPHLPTSNQALVQGLVERGFPIVMIDRPYPGVDCPVVTPDNYGGMRKAVEHLIQFGHKRIGFVTNEPGQRQTVGSVKDRERAYFDAMTAAGLSVNPEWVVELDPDLVQFFDSNPKIADAVAYEPVHKLMKLDPRPTAVVLLFDELAPGALRAIKNENLKIPADVSLVGFNDSPVAKLLEVPLTTVHYPSQLVGETTAEVLEKLIGGQKFEQVRWTLPTELVIRSSTGPVSI